MYSIIGIDKSDLHSTVLILDNYDDKIINFFEKMFGNEFIHVEGNVIKPLNNNVDYINVKDMIEICKFVEEDELFDDIVDEYHELIEYIEKEYNISFEEG